MEFPRSRNPNDCTAIMGARYYALISKPSKIKENVVDDFLSVLVISVRHYNSPPTRNSRTLTTGHFLLTHTYVLTVYQH